MNNIRLVRYTTRPDAAADNAELVRAVYEQLAATGADNFRYATLLVPSENSFVHLAISDDDHPPLPDLAAFQEFQRGLAGRTVAPVIAGPATVVGNYRLL
jgi:hypothetical protein